MLRRWPVGGAVAAAFVIALSVGATPAGARVVRSSPAPIDHVLIVASPAVTWSDVERQLARPGAPRGLARLLDGAATGDLSLRSVLRHTSLGEGYATLGAGTRTAGAPLGEGLAFDRDETFSGAPATATLARRLGRAPGPGAIVAPSVAAIAGSNRRLKFGSEPGAFGTALRAATVATAVVGNADPSLTETAPADYQRTATLALADRDGIVDGGDVSRRLLTPVPGAALGLALDRSTVSAAVALAARATRSVVLVEASDLVRADAERSLSAPAARAGIVDHALDRTAALLDMILDVGAYDPARDGLLVITPAHTAAAVHLGVAAAHLPGMRPGLLRSPSTRRAGFVTLVDVAPTVLSWMGVPRPDSMEGRPIEVIASSRSLASRIHMLARVDRDARARDHLVAPVTAIFIVLEALVAAAAVAVLGNARRGRRALEVAALSLFGYLAFVYLAVPLHVAEHGPLAYFAFLFGGGVVLSLVARAVGRRADFVAPMVLLAALLALLAGDLITGGRLQLNAVLGYSPTVGGRFAGAGNLTFAQLSACAILLAGLIAHWRGRQGLPVAFAVLGLAVIVDGLPLWGADVGGVLSLVPAAAITAVALTGWRIRPRIIAALAAGTAVAIGLATGVDLLRPVGHRSHLGRLVEQIQHDGFGAFGRVVERKASANLAVLTTSVWTLLVPVVLLFIAYLIYRAPGRLRIINEKAPELRATFAGVFVLAILGYSLNDSGIAVPALMLGVLNPVLVFLAARWT